MAAAPASSLSMITLKCGDGRYFEAEEAALTSNALTVRRIISHNRTMVDTSNSHTITLPSTVSSGVIPKVIEFCSMHGSGVVAAYTAEDMKLVDVDKRVLADLVVAASYLEMKGLLGLVSQAKRNADNEREEQRLMRLSYFWLFIAWVGLSLMIFSVLYSLM